VKTVAGPCLQICTSKLEAAGPSCPAKLTESCWSPLTLCWRFLHFTQIQSKSKWERKTWGKTQFQWWKAFYWFCFAEMFHWFSVCQTTLVDSRNLVIFSTFWYIFACLFSNCLAKYLVTLHKPEVSLSWSWIFIELKSNFHWVEVEFSLNWSWNFHWIEVEIFIELKLNFHWIEVEFSLNWSWIFVEIEFWLNWRWIFIELTLNVFIEYCYSWLAIHCKLIQICMLLGTWGVWIKEC
jgi:hypothetical protein